VASDRSGAWLSESARVHAALSWIDKGVGASRQLSGLGGTRPASSGDFRHWPNDAFDATPTASPGWRLATTQSDPPPLDPLQLRSAPYPWSRGESDGMATPNASSSLFLHVDSVGQRTDSLGDSA
jgi:hypothetical protein